jgi:hypothetical protein
MAEAEGARPLSQAGPWLYGARLRAREDLDFRGCRLKGYGVHTAKLSIVRLRNKLQAA